MISKEKIKEIIIAELEQDKTILVEVLVNSGNLIKVVLDSLTGVTINECSKISQLIESNLNRDVEDFELEVSSYGISQPFILPLHYLKNINKTVEIYLKGGKLIKGILKVVDCNETEVKSIEILQKKKVQLEQKKRKTEIEELIKLSGEEIQKAKLILDF